MVDASTLLDNEGESVPDVFLVASISLLVFLIADLGFTGFRAGNLGLIVTAFLFIITIVSYLALTKNTILSDGHVLDGALGFTIGSLVFNIGNILAGIEFNLLSSATTSYLSGILGSSSGIVIPLVNNIFAPIGETFLIFGLTAGIYEVAKRTRVVELSPLIQTFVVGFVPSTIFAFLHGARQPQFLLLAFGINMFWTALIVFGELGRIRTRWIPAGLGLVAGIHFSFNTSSYGGIPKFVGDLFAAIGGDFGRSAVAVLGFLFLMWVLGAYRAYLIASEEVL